METKIRLHSLVITVFLLSLWVFLQGEAQYQPQQIEECGEQNCADILTQVQDSFPEQIEQLEANCPAPSTLNLSMFQNKGEGERVSFICWDEVNNRGSRTGIWLGMLPLNAEDSTFAKPWICSQYDENCQQLLPQLRSQFPQEIQQAEFQCAMKNGALFLSDLAPEIDVRCGFFATIVWDENNDGIYDGEDPVSVDTSMGKFRLE